jgi:hypothetical protein
VTSEPCARHAISAAARKPRDQEKTMVRMASQVRHGTHFIENQSRPNEAPRYVIDFP